MSRLISLSCVHRTQHDGKHILFGTPILLIVDQSKESASQLKKRVLERLDNLCPGVAPRFVVCGVTGLKCVLCKNKQCTGCDLPLDQPLALDGKHLLVLDWDSNECSSKWKGFLQPTLHPSVVAARAEGEETISLQRCLDSLQAPQILTEGNELSCDMCAQKTLSTLTPRISTTSDHVMFQLNRFPRRELSDKLDIKVEYEPEMEILGELFELMAVVCHIGARTGSSSGGGHYVTFRKFDSSWLKCNDAVITKIALEHVVSNKNAYLLLYSKKSKK